MLLQIKEARHWMKFLVEKKKVKERKREEHGGRSINKEKKKGAYFWYVREWLV